MLCSTIHYCVILVGTLKTGHLVLVCLETVMYGHLQRLQERESPELKQVQDDLHGELFNTMVTAHHCMVYRGIYLAAMYSIAIVCARGELPICDVV